MGSEKPDLGSGRPDLGSERPDLGSERPDLVSESNVGGSVIHRRKNGGVIANFH